MRIETVADSVDGLRGALAVRSSAIDEDGAEASFAGQHLTLLNVRGADELASALSEVWWSANSDSAITYRQRVGPVHPPERRRRRAGPRRSPDRRRDVHPEPGHRSRRACDRGQLGPRRGGRRGAGDSRPLPDRPRRRGARAHARAQADRAALAARRRDGRGRGRPRARRAALPRRRRSSQRARPPGAALRGRLRPGPGHRVGDRRRKALPASVQGRDDGGQGRRGR